jgi:hypothetical protein
MRAILPADRLIEALGLRKRTTAQVQDLYSRPIRVEPRRPRLETEKVKRQREAA